MPENEIKIPIKNIYFLLCYAWDKLEQLDVIDVDDIDIDDMLNLFAKVLETGVSSLLKRGLDRYYIETQEVIPGICGKLLFEESLKRNLLNMGRASCEFDEFSHDILHNQILKSTIRLLLHTGRIDKEISGRLRILYTKFPQVNDIEIRNSDFARVSLHRNNRHYDILIKICQVLHNRLFIDETLGNLKFVDFERDERKMAQLFEAFVRNFYNKESEFKSSGEIIEWKFEPADEESRKVLPKMHTDITLTNADRKIIIDTKFYKQSLKGQYMDTLISGNLYQIYAYIDNQEDGTEVTQNCEGILLYPTIDNNFEYSYNSGTHRIRAISIDLNQHHDKIKERLLYIVGE